MIATVVVEKSQEDPEQQKLESNLKNCVFEAFLENREDLRAVQIWERVLSLYVKQQCLERSVVTER